VRAAVRESTAYTLSSARLPTYSVRPRRTISVGAGTRAKRFARLRVSIFQIVPPWMSLTKTVPSGSRARPVSSGFGSRT